VKKVHDESIEIEEDQRAKWKKWFNKPYTKLFFKDIIDQEIGNLMDEYPNKTGEDTHKNQGATSALRNIILEVHHKMDNNK